MTSVLSQALRPVVQLVDRLRGGPAEPVPPSLSDDPDAQPYTGGDGPDGVLLVHGFTGTPQCMRPWADHLEAAGFTVSLPRLPGHGTHWRELNQTAWPDWYAQVDAAFDDLRSRCDRVFLAGLSMGGTLCLRLAEQRGAEVAGLVVVNPVVTHRDIRVKAMPILHLLIPSLRAIGSDIADPTGQEIAYDRTPLRALNSQTQLWADVVARLDRISQPLLVYRSAQDHVVDDSSLTLLKERLATADVEFRTLTRSYHVATLDYEAADIFAGSVEFYRRLSA